MRLAAADVPLSVRVTPTRATRPPLRPRFRRPRGSPACTTPASTARASASRSSTRARWPSTDSTTAGSSRAPTSPPTPTTPTCAGSTASGTAPTSRAIAGRIRSKAYSIAPLPRLRLSSARKSGILSSRAITTSPSMRNHLALMMRAASTIEGNSEHAYDVIGPRRASETCTLPATSSAGVTYVTHQRSS